MRKVERGDLEILLRLLNSNWYGKHTWSLSNPDDQEWWFEVITKDPTTVMFLVFDVTKKLAVGVYKLGCIDLINRSAQSSHDVFVDKQGNGYGYLLKEAGVDFAFEMFGLYRLDTEVLENNLASQKTIERAGFTQEGVRSEAVFRCGERLDSLTYGLTLPNWKRLSRVKKYEGCCNISYQPKNKQKTN